MNQGVGMPGMPPGIDLGRDPNGPSKKEQFRVLALNIAMGIENGRVDAVKAEQHANVPGNVGDTGRIIKDAEAIAKFLDTGH